ncbi:MAG: DUF262 domain-containing protein [Mediterranea sp.]|jgi:hypothetical protein|nr:DUF262 domain-containing protein [Mediterranea sp.]
MEKISIKSDREYLREIMAKIKSGAYAVPIFQRDFVWKETQIIELFDSIAKGYPIGSIILWKQRDIQLTEYKDILTDKKKQVETTQPDYYILDGRQRLTAFYGCTSITSNDENFKLYYNLEDGEFMYANKKGKKRGQDELLAVSTIWDTFALIDALQQISQNIVEKDRAERYISKAKRMNEILQSYTVTEILMEDCSLDEARIVFSRVNSKGTDISKAYMLQAMSYKEPGKILLADEIDHILSSLGKYNFEGLSQDAVLNCFYQYAGINFYDISKTSMSSLEHVDFQLYIHDIKKDIRNAVAFLHDECYVLSSKLLPYAKQLVAIVAFFRAHRAPTPKEKEELKRWFFYTTYQQSFQNGSLPNTRRLFNNFDKFVKAQSNSPIEYEPVSLLDSFDFRFDINSAKTDFLLLTQICHYAKSIDISRLTYEGYVKIESYGPEAYVLILRHEDRLIIDDIINNRIVYEEDIDKYALSQEMLKLLHSNNKEEFRQERTKRLLEIEREFLESMNIEIEE